MWNTSPYRVDTGISGARHDMTLQNRRFCHAAPPQTAGRIWLYPSQNGAFAPYCRTLFHLVQANRDMRETGQRDGIASNGSNTKRRPVLR
jgi:hypothetical protein